MEYIVLFIIAGLIPLSFFYFMGFFIKIALFFLKLAFGIAKIPFKIIGSIFATPKMKPSKPEKVHAIEE